MGIRVSRKIYKLAKIFGQEKPLYIVGGYVRDRLMGVKSQDVDLASSCTIEEVENLLKGTPYKVVVKDKSLGAIKIDIGQESYDYTTFRIEEYKENGGRHPTQIVFTTSIIDDARRRDFTVNAIYYHILSKKVIDIYGGVQDVFEQRIKCIETPEYVFKDDGLRILRMIRLSAELGFTIDESTLYEAKQRLDKLETISQERMSSEFVKIIYASHKYNKGYNNNKGVAGLKLFDKLGLWKYINKNDDYLNILSGIGSFLKCYKHTKKDNALLAFLTDAYLYVSNFSGDIDPEVFTHKIFGPNGIILDEKTIDDLSERLKLVLYVTDRNLSANRFKLCVAYRLQDIASCYDIIDNVRPGINREIVKTYRRLVRTHAPIDIDKLKITKQNILDILHCDEDKANEILYKLQDICVLEPDLNTYEQLRQEVISKSK